MSSSVRAGRALLAARAVAAAHGVAAGEARVLRDGVNVVVHLAPAPVVARVATLTPLLRPAPLRSLTREVALAGALAAAGAPVVPPSDLLPPGPHRYAGLELSFWRHVEVLPVAPSPGEVGAALAGLHDHLAVLPVTGSPLDTPLDDLTRFLALGHAWGAAPERLELLAARLEELRPQVGGDVVALHGDAHPGNLLATPDGWRWTDLEDTCPGPRAWDLACLRATTRLDGRAAVDVYPGAPADEDLAPWLELRRLHAAAWTLAVATGHPELRPAADDRMAASLQASGSAGSR
ncbi:phosphotransferase family protein [Geodermatophilus sp. DSM 45219]|uniref:phosphotransferase family protein n=1 Tax=Geodermatophilus sp. DSM 45219 TaxID=1881103 RepID=UPI000884CC27|nr:phosphotransferase [Geodermatophilus sp. DSM 45219]SDN46472.1 Thiamine kinase [Geodermatophilus sp. DSM 45219]